MNGIQLTVPSTDNTKNPATITQLSVLESWIKELPTANPLQAAKMLLASLSLLNRHPGTVSNRIELLNCYQSPIHLLTDSARKKRHNTQRRESSELHSLTEKMATEIAYGYKIALKELNYLHKSRLSPVQQASLIYRAIHSLNLCMLFSFSEHRPEPQHIWSEILQLYLLSESLGIPREAVDFPQQKTDNTLTIRNLFKAISLIMLIDPFTLQHDEVWQLFSYLSWWSGHALITALKSVENEGSGHFVIDFGNSKKPFLLKKDSPPENPENCLLLDTTPLCVLMDRQLHALTTQGAVDIPGLNRITDPAAQQLLRRMLVAWHIHPNRRHPRQERYDWLIIASGITDITHYLKYGSIHTSSEREGDNEEELVTINDTSLFHQQPVHNTYRWRQTNISLSGIGLEITPDNAGNIQVGQLVLMESERNEGELKLTIGVVRRYVVRSRNTLEAGIQFIQGDFTAATIKPMVFGATDSADFQPALLHYRGEKSPPVIFTPQLIYHHEQEYFVEAGKHLSTRIYADKLLEATSSYERFEYHPIQLHG